MQRLSRGTPKKGEAVSLPRGDTPALSPIAVALETAAVRPVDPSGAAKLVLRKIGGGAVLARKRAYIATDE